MPKRKTDSSSEDETPVGTPGEELAHQFFKFIDLSSNDPVSQRENRTRARSHAMKNVRRRRRDPKQPGDEIALSTDRLASSLRDLYSQTFSTPISRPSTPSSTSRQESDINSSQALERRWSPIAHEIQYHNRRFGECRWTCGHLADLDPVATTILASIFPSTSSNETAAPATQVWDAMRTSPMVFHAIIAGSAAIRDTLYATTSTSTQYRSVEALTHRGQALRLINEGLSALQREDGSTEEPSDELLLAVLSLTPEPIENFPLDHSASAPTSGRATPVNTSSRHPFRLDHMPSGWEQQCLSVQHNRLHHDALFTLVERRGGIDNIKNRAIAKMISNHDVLIAALDLAPPKQPHCEVEEITNLLKDTSLNILTNDQQEFQSGGDETLSPGAGLDTLLHIGVTNDLLRILKELHYILAAKEAIPRGAIKNVNLTVLGSRKQALHHAILSLPSRPPSIEDPTSNSLYEAVRLVTLILDMGILFPLPPCLGLLARLVRSLRRALETIHFSVLDLNTASALSWISLVGGIAAKGMDEDRRWFAERLVALLGFLGIRRCAELKNVLRRYVWMTDAMDGEGMEFWDDVRDLMGRVSREGSG